MPEEIKLRQEITEAESKDKLILEYLNLCMVFTDPQTTPDMQKEIKFRLNQIRNLLGMNKIHERGDTH